MLSCLAKGPVHFPMSEFFREQSDQIRHFGIIMNALDKAHIRLLLFFVFSVHIGPFIAQSSNCVSYSCCKNAVYTKHDLI